MSLIDQMRERAAARTPFQEGAIRDQEAKQRAEQRLSAFEARHPDIATWWRTNGGEFAQSLRSQVREGRQLSDRQMEAAERAATESRARLAEAKPVTTTNIVEVFDRARANGVKRPSLRIDGMKFSPAPTPGKNAGAIYVKTRDGEYLGKVLGGLFQRSSVCSMEQANSIVEAMEHPAEAAIRYGKVSGECSVCGRELTDANSIAAGIGPICETRYFR